MTKVGNFYRRAIIGAIYRRNFALLTTILTRAAQSSIPYEDFDSLARMIKNVLQWRQH